MRQHVSLIFYCICLSLAQLAIAQTVQSESGPALLKKADAAYSAKMFAEAAQLYSSAILRGIRSAEAPYNAACAFALSGDKDNAFISLQRAADADYRGVTGLLADSDLSSLHDDPRWAGLVNRVEANKRQYEIRHADPEGARLVTIDVDNFWKMFDKFNSVPDDEKSAFLQSAYFDKGSLGLESFLLTKIGSEDEMVKAIKNHLEYYASIRPSTLSILSMEPRIRQSFRKLKEIYPAAQFPDVYFVIGRLNSGGTSTDAGLLIGAEMYGRTPKTPTKELDDWLRSVLGPIDGLPHVVAHELIHFQQHIPTQTLLGRALYEGGADFVAERISGAHINPVAHSYGNSHEAELWQEFKRDMHGKEVGGWMYQGNTIKGRPADLGYFVGYKIVQAYYNKAKDKRRAIAEILKPTSIDQLLEESGYEKSFLSAAVK